MLGRRDPLARSRSQGRVWRWLCRPVLAAENGDTSKLIHVRNSEAELEEVIALTQLSLEEAARRLMEPVEIHHIGKSRPESWTGCFWAPSLIIPNRPNPHHYAGLNKAGFEIFYYSRPVIGLSES